MTNIVTQNQAVAQPVPANGAVLIGTMAQRFGVEPRKLMDSLKKVVFKQTNGELSNEELMSVAIVANEYELNPFLKEIYAFRGKNGAIMPMISVDGWLRILNRQPDYDGMSVTWGPDISIPGENKLLPEWCEVAIHRKNLSHPVIHREYMAECLMDTLPWKKHPRRMLKHRAVIQGIRYAFGVSGAFDEESVKEAEGSVEINGTSTFPVMSGIKLQNVLVKAMKMSNINIDEWIDQQIHPSQHEQAKAIVAQLTKPVTKEPETVQTEVVEAVQPQETPPVVEEDLRLEGE